MSRTINLVKPIDILLVEDDPGDVRLTQEALDHNRALNKLHICNDGEEALNFLFRRNGFEDAVRPDLILLDLNLPRVSGQDVLREIKECEELCTIPVVVLTTSKAEEDIVRAYKLHANCYVTKPVGWDQFTDIISSIKEFWLGIVKLPNGV